MYTICLYIMIDFNKNINRIAIFNYTYYINIKKIIIYVFYVSPNNKAIRVNYGVEYAVQL